MEKTNLPTLESVIAKIKCLKELSPEEEIVYLIHIENLSEKEASDIIREWYPEIYKSRYTQP